jgi:hypothetical protein
VPFLVGVLAEGVGRSNKGGDERPEAGGKVGPT